MKRLTLKEAREYEKESMNISGEKRPGFHLSTRIGWMNDPNGFSYCNGKYHMFYQYNPYDTKWDSMHWGHAVSEDMLHWTYLPAALAPDQDYDAAGCFSGSAIELSDGRHLLMYTGVEKKQNEKGEWYDTQTQCIAVGNGMDYEKYENNPVLDGEDLPEGASRIDFRDPKIWEKEDGSFACVVGSRPADGSGQILMYTSPDGFDWKFDKVLIENKRRYGEMWECPDFFELNGKNVLLTSPQDMLPQGLEYHNGNGTLCVIGDYDGENFTEEQNQAIDYGIDFYAPQTTLTPDGRRIMIGWMQNWETCNSYKSGEEWFGQMSIPRELSIVDGKLIQKPAREVDALRKEKVEYHKLVLEKETVLENIKGRRIDMELELDLTEKEGCFDTFEIQFAQNASFHTSLIFNRKEQLLTIDRSHAGSTKDILHRRSCLVKGGEEKLKLRIILDQYSAEVFVNDGKQVMTVTFYTEPEADGVVFLTDGTARIDICKYEME